MKELCSLAGAIVMGLFTGAKFGLGTGALVGIAAVGVLMIILIALYGLARGALGARPDDD